MMKQIMKRAWQIYRTLTGDKIAKLSMALRQAWAEAKEAAEKKTFSGRETMMWMLNDHEGFEVSFKLWENYGKKRIYFQSNSTRAQVALKGYIDCDNHNAIVISTSRFCGIESIVNDFLNAYAV